jgi:hypothetical protein
MLKPGDVVFGKFPTPDGCVLNHWSIVLMANEEGAMLAYTTSMKGAGNPSTIFSKDDMRLATFGKPCRWDASQCAVVPHSAIAFKGRVTKVTLTKLLAAFQRARDCKTLTVVLMSSSGELVYH